MSDVLIALVSGLALLTLSAGVKRIGAGRHTSEMIARVGAELERTRIKERSPVLEGLGNRIAMTRGGAWTRSRLAVRHPNVSFSDALAGAAAGSLAGALVGYVGFGGGAMCVVGALAGPAALDRMALRWGGRRLARLEQQLPEALLVQAAALRAGHSILRSLRAISEEVPPPMRQEIATTVRELDLGIPLEAALEKLKARAGGRDIELWVTSMLVHKVTGGNLARSIEDLSERIRSRSHLRSEIRALTAQGRLSGSVVAAAPLGFFAVLSVTSKEQMEVLFTTPIGLSVLVVGIAMEIAGFLWIRRILRVSQ